MLWYCGQRIVERPRTPVESSFAKNRTMSTSPIPGPAPVYEDYARCIHCGLCLNACPTYRHSNLDAISPRGRLHQMTHDEVDQQPITDSFVDHIDKCLDCRACETACPSGVEYGKLVEHARARIERDYPRSWLARVTRDFVFRHLLPDPHRIIDAARVLRFYQRSGLQAIARGIGVLKLLGLAERERLLPRIDDDFFFRRLGWAFPAVGPRRARVAFFAGCIANVTFSQLNEATIRVLTAAGCGSALKEYHHLFSQSEGEHSQACEFAAKTRDVTEFLAALGLTARLKPLPIRVTYQDSCHLLHGQKIREAPRALLHAIPNLDFVELPYSEICCGSAGVYNVTQTEASLELLTEKMRHAQSTRAQTIVTANPGCLLQLRAGAAIHRTNQEVLHVVELLDRSIRP